MASRHPSIPAYHGQLNKHNEHKEHNKQAQTEVKMTGQVQPDFEQSYGQPAVWLLICLTILVGAMALASAVQKDFGNVHVSNVTFRNFNGIAARAKLLQPENDSGKQSLPGVVYIQESHSRLAITESLLWMKQALSPPTAFWIDPDRQMACQGMGNTDGHAGRPVVADTPWFPAGPDVVFQRHSGDSFNPLCLQDEHLLSICSCQ